MVRFIFGEKGAGNSKRIIQMANDSLNQTKGSVVFIDAEGQYLFELKHAIRFTDGTQYDVKSPNMFAGFLEGIAAQDFDIERIYVDGVDKIVKRPSSDLCDMFAWMQKFSERSGIEMVVSLSGDQVPEYCRLYMAE